MTVTTQISRRSFLALGAAAAAGTLLAGCDGEVHEAEGVVVAKYSVDGIEWAANDISDWTLTVDVGGGYEVDVPVSEYDYRRVDVGVRVRATGTDGNVWMVTP